MSQYENNEYTLGYEAGQEDAKAGKPMNEDASNTEVGAINTAQYVEGYKAGYEDAKNA